MNTEQVTLNNLIPGKVYVISISGYTSAGEGKTRTVSAACKFCNLLRKVLSLSVSGGRVGKDAGIEVVQVCSLINNYVGSCSDEKRGPSLVFHVYFVE